VDIGVQPGVRGGVLRRESGALRNVETNEKSGGCGGADLEEAATAGFGNDAAHALPPLIPAAFISDARWIAWRMS